ncbi:hypothetical protein, partial [Pseudanabaena sp. 'Roaring Creek']|uniref:hypothetical protein n=1 Tax=Pseudanabaena sp. 'Roaring Creek' TaxID=1681830 RepID=UPI001E4E0940
MILIKPKKLKPKKQGQCFHVRWLERGMAALCAAIPLFGFIAAACQLYQNINPRESCRAEHGNSLWGFDFVLTKLAAAI